MDLFKDYFSEYVSEFQLSSLAQGQILRFTVHRADRELSIVLSLDTLVDFSVFKSAQDSIKEKMNLKKVSIKPRYLSSLFEASYIPSVIEFVKIKNPSANGFFDGASYDYNEPDLKISLQKGGLDILTAQKVNEDIENVIFDLFSC